VLALSVAIWHALTSAQATASVPVFGPKKYVRTTGAPNQYEDRFDIPNSIRSPFTLHIVNGDAAGAERISSATITLNGVAVATPKDFSKQVGTIDLPITLQASNTLHVTLASEPEGFLTIGILANDRAPVVNAGSGQTITWPASAALNGSATDDGLPLGNTLTSLWSVVSGPGTVTFANRASPTTTASFSLAGTYVLRLTATDSLLSSSADVTITVLQADANIQVAGYAGTYDGNTHGATGTATGVQGENLNSLLHLGASFMNVPGGAAQWTFDGSTNYKPASGSVSIAIGQADAAIHVNGFSGVFDGNPHGATGTATGVRGEDLSALFHPGTTFTDRPGGTAHWTFDGNSNYKPAAGDVAIAIAGVDARIQVSGYTGVFDGNPHGATGTAIGVRGEDLSALLHLGGTFVDGPGGQAQWTFDGNNDYNVAAGQVTITIAPANAAIQVNGFSGVFDGNPHGASGTAVGVKGEDLRLLLHLGVAFTNAPGGTAHWTFDGNADYKPASGDAPIVIGQTDALVQVAGFNGLFDGKPHGATGTAVGVAGENLSALLHLGAAFIDPPGGTAHWTFDGNANYKPSAGDATIAITQSNHPPSFTSAPVTTAKHQIAYSYQATATDPDGDALKFTLATAPPGMTIDSATGLIGWTPTGNQIGPQSVVVVVADPFNASATQAFDVTVADVTPPVVTLKLQSEALPGTAVITTADAFDNVGVVSVTFEVNGANPTDQLSAPYQRTISVPADAVAGTEFHVRATARDAAGNAGVADGTFKVAAVPDTQPPTIVLHAPPQATVGATIRVTASAADNVGVKTITFAADGAALPNDPNHQDETTYVVPSNAVVGSSIQFSARAVDFSNNLADATAATLVVATPDTTPPTVELTAPPTIPEGGTLQLSATANDDVGVAGVEFSVNGVPVGTATLAPYTASFRLPASVLGGDVLQAQARAFDAAGNEATSRGATSVLAAPNRPPTADAGGPYASETGALVSLTAAASNDPDPGDRLSYDWDFGDSSTGSGIAPVHAYADQGTYTVTVTVSDGRGGVSTATAIVTITAATDRNPPNVALFGPATALPGAQVTMTARATDDRGVTGVTFEVNGGDPSDTSVVPYQRVVNIPAIAAAGDKVAVRATARDAAGNHGSADATITITALPDTEPPAVTVNAPPQAAAGSTVRISATAQDNVGVASLTITVNGGAPTVFFAPPYETTYTIPADAAAGSVIGVVATGTDYTGNHGDATATVTVVAPTDGDSVPPTVKLTAPLQVLVGKKLSLSADPHDNVGVASVAFFVDGVNVATLTAPPYSVDVDLTSSQVAGTLLKLRAVATDFANLQGFDTAQTLVISTATAGQGVLTGELYDDSTSLPLAGATVTLIGADAMGDAYTQTTTTDKRGRWVLRAAEGQPTVRMTKSGWTTVDRPATILANQAIELFDGRSTRSTDPTNISAVLGGTVTRAPGSLQLPAGALATATDLGLTPLSQQGLQGIVPPGWSPIAQSDITPHGVTFAVAGTLSLANTFKVPAGRTVVAATWDEGAAGWRAVGSSTVPSGAGPLQTDVAATGQYAFFLADTAPATPPAPAPGDLLAGIALAPLVNDAVTTVSPQPSILFYSPGVRSDVHGVIATSTPSSSGLPIESRLSESYRFLAGGGDLQPEPFVEDLFFYQVGGPATGVGATFTVTPSQVFEALSLQLGVITVELMAPPLGTRTVTSIGADGGSAASSSGEVLQVPQGALSDPLPISVRGLTASNLGVSLPAGFDLAGAALVSFSGALAKPAVLAVARPPEMTDATRLLLVRPQELGGETRLVLVGRARIVGNQILSDSTLPGVSDTLEGVRIPGRYFFIRSAQPFGFVKGTVTSGASPFAGALVSNSTFPIVALSAQSGAYVEAAALGAFTLTALDLQRSDFGSADANMPAAGSVVALNLQIATALPTVTSVVPSDGATNVPLSNPVTVRFSRSLDPASVNGTNAGNATLTAPDGTLISASVSLSDKNTLLTLRPATALDPNTVYAVTLTTGIADQVGRHMASPFVAHFTSFDTAPPPAPPAGSIQASIPGSDGYITITATQGTAGVHDTVTVVNLSKKSTNPVLVDSNGGFTVRVPVGITDKVQIAITAPSGAQTTVALPRLTQTNADGSVSAVVLPEGGLIEGPGGTAIEVPSGAFPDGTIVTLKAIAEADFPVQLDAQGRTLLSYSGGLQLDLGGKTPQHYLNVFVPAGPNDKTGDQFLVSLVRDDNGTPVLNVVDTAKVIGSRIRTSSPPCPGVTGAGVYGIHKSLQPVGVNYAQMYSMGYGGLQMRASVIFPSLTLPIPLPWMALEPINVPTVCYPVLTGKVSVTANTQRLIVPMVDLAPTYREFIIRNTTSGTETHYPRNVIDLNFSVTGTVTDTFTAKTIDSVGIEHPTSVSVADDTATTVRVGINVDTITTSVASVVITNVTSGVVTTFNQNLVALKLSAPGGATDTFEVNAVDAQGVTHLLPGIDIESPNGAGNMLARAVEGAIDPTQAEILAFNAAHPGNPISPILGRSKVELIDETTSTTYLIPASSIVNGAFNFDFNGVLNDKFRLLVTYDDQSTDFVDILTFQITVSNRTTGRVLRTITFPSPPKDQPLNLGVLSDDIQPPILTASPARMSSFDPSAPLTFRFSEAMDATSLKNGIIVERVSGGVRTRVTGEIRVSDGNTVATFVPDTPLRVAQEYSITFVGKDALGSSLGGGAPPVTDRSGNSLATARFKLTTFKPRTVGSYPVDFDASGQPVELKDVEIYTQRISGKLKTFAVATAEPRNIIGAYRVVTVDVSDPAHPAKMNSTAGGSGKKRLTLLTGLGTPEHPAMPVRSNPPTVVAKTCDPASPTPYTAFTGNLAVTASANTDTSYVSFFDLTDLAHSCLIGGKTLTANPDTLNDFSSPGTVHALGFARSVATIQHSAGYAAYIAVAEVGLFAVDIGKSIPEQTPLERVQEAYAAGDYNDVIAFSDKLLATNHGESTLDLFDPQLTRLGSVQLSAPPRRVVAVSGYAVDKNGDGLITPDEQLDLAIVAVDSPSPVVHNIAIVDITNLDNMTVLAEIPMPGIVRELAVDADKHRLFAGGDGIIPGTAVPGSGAPLVVQSLFMVDLVNPFDTNSVDADGDGIDDRVIWTNQYPKGINGFRVEKSRGLLYVASPAGLDIWAVYDACCDLGIDMTAAPPHHQTGDRDALLAKEAAALQQEITAGLHDAETQCTPLSLPSIKVFEQGSGACLWKGNPLHDCGSTYQPGLSDHDFELLFVPGTPTQVQSCTVTTLTARFTNAETGEPKDITLPDGSSVRFEDVTFFPFDRSDFENAKLNVNPPASSGTDSFGDFGLGRQQLLLLWLLGGEYVPLPNLPAVTPGVPLDQLLTRLRTTTGISQLEGFEWANLQAFSFAKSTALLRFKGGADPASSLHEIFVRQLHGAGKAAIRTAFGRLISDTAGNRIALNVARRAGPGVLAGTPLYQSNACLMVSSTTPPNEWLAKPCGSFEEYAASAIARTVQGPTPLSLFTLPEVLAIHRFYRVKADEERIGNDTDADAFVAGVWQFIEAAKTQTATAYNQLITIDPDRAQRGLNLTNVQNKRTDALHAASAVLHPRIFNHGFRSAEGISVGMYYADAPNSSLPGPTIISVDLAGGDERFLDFEQDASGSAKPIFKLKDVDLTLDLGVPHGVSFTIDLPEHKIKEANRENNLGGFFYYVLDVNAPTPPTTPPTPYVPFSDPDVLKPDPECDDGPALAITQRVVSSSGAITGEGEVGLGEQITIELHVKNLSGDTQEDVMVCSNITNACYSVGNLAVGADVTFTVSYDVPKTGVYLEGTPTTYSTEAGVVAGAPTRLIASCEPYRVVELSNNPNPEDSELMQGGKTYRYYRIVNRRTGDPIAGASITAEAEGLNFSKAYTYASNADGLITTGSERGLIIPTEPGMIFLEAKKVLVDGKLKEEFGSTLDVSITEVNGVSPSCEARVSYEVGLVDREYSQGVEFGRSIKGSIGLIATVAGSAETGLGLEKESSFSTGPKKLWLSEGYKIGGKAGVEFSLIPGFESDIGPFEIKFENKIGASVGVEKGPQNLYLFPYVEDPAGGKKLSDASLCAIAGITLSAYAGVDPIFSKIVDIVRTNSCADPTPYRIAHSLEQKKEFEASASLELSFDSLALHNNHLQIEAGGDAGFNFGVATRIGFESHDLEEAGFGGITDVDPDRLRGAVDDLKKESYTLTAGYDWKVGLSAKPPEEKESDHEDRFELFDRALGAGVGASKGGAFNVTFEYPLGATVTPDTMPSRIQVTYQGEKNFGLSAVGGLAFDKGFGKGQSVTFEFDDQDAIQKAVNMLPSLKAIRDGAVEGSTSVPTLPLTSANITTEFEAFQQLLDQTVVPYEVDEKTATSGGVAIGGGGKWLGLKIGAKLQAKSDRSVNYKIETGVNVRGGTFPLEKYQKDAYVPGPDLSLTDLIDLAWDSIKTLASGDVSDVSAHVDTRGPPTTVKSTMTATLVVDGTKEPAPIDVGLFSYHFRPVTTPTSEGHYRPADVAGPAGMLHYGIGGFHQFTPEGYTLAVPTPLVIDFTDAEVAGTDKSTLAIYMWNPTTKDWDRLGGVVDPVANTVTLPITTLGLYTVGPTMPSGDVSLTFTDHGVVGVDASATERFTVTSGLLHLNDGQTVPDGTLFTVRSVAADGMQATTFGTILATDEDPGRDNIQVSAQGGVIQFDVEYPAPFGFLVPGRVAIYSTVGTTYGEVVVKP
jgi:hypothetical protein